MASDILPRHAEALRVPNLRFFKTGMISSLFVVVLAPVVLSILSFT
jgi:hypothetical protein